MTKDKKQDIDLMYVCEQTEKIKRENKEEREEFRNYLQNAVSFSERDEIIADLDLSVIQEEIYNALSNEVGDNIEILNELKNLFELCEKGDVTQKQLTKPLLKLTAYNSIKSKVKYYVTFSKAKKKILEKSILRYNRYTVDSYVSQISKKKYYESNPFSTVVGVIKAYRNFKGEFVCENDVNDLVDDCALYIMCEESRNLSEDDKNILLKIKEFLEYVAFKSRKVDKQSVAKFFKNIQATHETEEYSKSINIYLDCKRIRGIDINVILESIALDGIEALKGKMSTEIFGKILNSTDINIVVSTVVNNNHIAEKIVKEYNNK